MEHTINQKSVADSVTITFNKSELTDIIKTMAYVRRKHPSGSSPYLDTSNREGVLDLLEDIQKEANW